MAKSLLPDVALLLVSSTIFLLLNPPLYTSTVHILIHKKHSYIIDDHSKRDLPARRSTRMDSKEYETVEACGPVSQYRVGQYNRDQIRPGAEYR